MVILPAARGLGASRRGFSRQQEAGAGARVRSRLEAPHAPRRDPGGQGRRLPPAAALAPASRLPPRGPPRSALAGARLAAAASGWAEGARRPGRRRPLPGARPAGLRETERGLAAAGGREAETRSGSALGWQRHPLGTAGNCVQCALGRVAGRAAGALGNL